MLPWPLEKTIKHSLVTYILDTIQKQTINLMGNSALSSILDFWSIVFSTRFANKLDTNQTNSFVILLIVMTPRNCILIWKQTKFLFDWEILIKSRKKFRTQIHYCQYKIIIRSKQHNDTYRALVFSYRLKIDQNCI